MKGFKLDERTGKYFKEFNCSEVYHNYHCFLIYDAIKHELQIMVGKCSGRGNYSSYPCNIIFTHDFLVDRFDIVMMSIKKQIEYTHHYFTNYHLQGRP